MVYACYDELMKKAVDLVASFVVLVLVVFLVSYQARAEDCNLHCLEEQIQKLEDQRKLSEDATKPLESQVVSLSNRVQAIGGQIVAFEQRLDELAESIVSREADLADDYLIMTRRVREFYKRSRSNSALLALLSKDTASRITRELTYQSAVTDQDKKVITTTTEELVALEQDKKKLEESTVQLAGLQTRLNEQAEFYKVEISKAKEYQEQLSKQIADLTARQQEILAEKAGTFQTSVGDVPVSADPASRPDYNPGFSPAFAAFSFGAPHYKGMSQYGAYGRALEGQSAEDILRAYYGDGLELKKDYSQGIQIQVQGLGTYSIEDYVMRLHEVPNSWGDNGGMEALKAQAVAARSYALAYTNNGSGSICATESCQVVKASPKGGAWEQAVNETRGWVLVSNGQPFSAWYASTSGGYQESYTAQGHTTPGFWDTKSGRSGWTSEAYEKISGSPWFYKGWYKSRSGDACGRSHPWLTSEEMADILNAWVVLVKHGQGDDRVTPQGPCWGGNPYSLSELKSRAEGLSVGYGSVSGVSVTYRDDGITADVSFSTDKGSVTIDGLDFKKAFNLRAPGRVALKSGLFNIESK